MSADGSAARWMLISAGALSFIPLCLDLSGGADASLILNALWRLGWSAGALALVCVLYPDLAFNPRIVAMLLRRAFSWHMLAMILNGAQMGLVAWGSGYVNIAVTAMMFYTWPLWQVFALALVYRGAGRFSRIGGRTIGVMTIGIAGAVMVGLSERGGLGASVSDGGVWLDCALGLIASLLSAGAAVGLLWGTDAAREMRRKRLIAESDFKRAELFCAVHVIIIAGLICAMICVFGGIAGGEIEAIDFNLVLYALGGGFIVHSVGDFAWRKSALGAKNLAVMALGCCVPLGSLAALWAFGRVDVARLDYLAIGVSLLVAANITMAIGGAQGRGAIRQSWRWLMGQTKLNRVIDRYWSYIEPDEDGLRDDSSIAMEIAVARCDEDCPCGCDRGDRFTPPGLCGCDSKICGECGLCDCCCHALADISGCSQSPVRLAEEAAAIASEGAHWDELMRVGRD